VWEATHTVIRRSVALKLLKSREDEAMRRFFREARVTAALQHPHIVEVSDVFVVPESGTPAMVMELLAGAPLSRWLRTKPPGRLALPEAARVLLQVVAAVGAAQSVGVVHRDLKPENIFLVGESVVDPRVKVLDFGLAKLTAEAGAMASTGKLTRSGFVLGTPHYMAPEQIAIDVAVDPRADVWALGVILYECLAGARPIEGTSLPELFRALAEPDIVPLAKRVPKLPRAVGKLVGRMLTKDRDARPSLEEIHDVLTDCST
jgi:serine/threonine-protein kinase